jgi:hypothetical protein
MLAIGKAATGCDLERIDETLDWQPPAEPFFAPTERATLTALPSAAAPHVRFFIEIVGPAVRPVCGARLTLPIPRSCTDLWALRKAPSR